MVTAILDEDLYIFYRKYIAFLQEGLIHAYQESARWEYEENERNRRRRERANLAEYYGWQGNGSADDFLDNM